MNDVSGSKPTSPLLKQCPESLPAAFYFDHAQFEIELKKIWACNWIYVGRLSDLKLMAFKQGRLMPQEFDVFNFQQWVRNALT